MGSKDKIAMQLLSVIPAANNFYDLFAGGCAITHAVLLHHKWENIIANDIQGTTDLFLDAIKGKFCNEKRWISRKDFFRLKDNDPYVRWIWSFGNNGRTYIFGRDIELIKKEAHEYLFSHGYDYTNEKRIRLIKDFKNHASILGRFELEQLERLQQLERLEQLSRLERLERLERLQCYAKDYRDIEIKSDSVVYCDIPYKQKENVSNEKYYGLKFNHLEFYEWAAKCEFPVYFSSCFCDNFECVWQCKSSCKMNNKGLAGKKEIIEKLYWNGKGRHVKQTLF